MDPVHRDLDPEELLAHLADGRDPSPLLARVDIPAVPPSQQDWPGWVSEPVRSAFAATGVRTLYPHQVAAAEHIRAGRHVALATGTASGKSAAYLIPACQAIVESERPGHEGTTLYVAPTKALARDQLRRIEQLDLAGVRVAAYDGDTDNDDRRWARRHATIVLTNPDMLHRAILPGHASWSSFLRRLRLVVIDEMHHHRGVQGAHLAAVLRRLRRLCGHHGSAPSMVGVSATVQDPATTLSRLIGAPAEEVVDDRTPRGRTLLGVWNPPHEEDPDTGESTRPSAMSETADIVARLAGQGVRTLAFVRSRRASEAVADRVRRTLLDTDPRLADRVAAYRSGYLPEERRDLEQRLRSGDLLAVSCTSALELGIDVSGVDAVVVAGWPGTRASFRQRIGRAGRGHGQALAVLVAQDDPMDQYLATHPEQILDAAEAIVLDPGNPYVLAGHLCAAAAELPLTDADAADWFGRSAGSLLPTLAERGFLRRRPTGWYWLHRERAVDLVDIRGGRGEPVAVVEEGTGRLIATVDAAAAHRTVHAGAVYTHQGIDHLITEWRGDEHTAIARRDRPGYTTWALETTDIRIADRDRSTSTGSVTRCFGTVEVSSQVTEFLRRRPGSGEVIGREPLDLPVRTLTTRAVWWEIPPSVLDAAGLEPASVGGAAHAAEHAAIGLLPLLATCDRWDIGGLSTAHHPDTGVTTIIVYDGYPGGAGFAEQGYAVAEEWLTHTAELIETCPCTHGCPSCVYSPKCGNGNEPLDKPGAAALLRAMLDADRIDLAAGADLRDRPAGSAAAT